MLKSPSMDVSLSSSQEGPRGHEGYYSVVLNSHVHEKTISPSRHRAIAQAHHAAQVRQDQYMVERVGREMAVIRKRLLIRKLQTKKMAAVVALMLAGVGFLGGWVLRGTGQVLPTNVSNHTPASVSISSPIESTVSIYLTPAATPTVHQLQPSATPTLQTVTVVGPSSNNKVQAIEPQRNQDRPKTGIAALNAIVHKGGKPMGNSQSASKPTEPANQGGIDVDISPSATKTTTNVKTAQKQQSSIVMAEGGVLTLREGTKVSSYKIGERLPDGNTLKSAENGEYKSSP